jgi:hypothetical protein
MPLLIHWPGVAGGGTNDALTTSVDLFATIADIYGATAKQRTHGRSLIPLFTGEATSVREWAIGGVWGSWVQVTDGRHKYARGPAEANFPLSTWSNRWSTMPIPIDGFDALPPPDQRAWLDTMPGSEIPVIRQPYAPGDRMPIWATGAAVGNHLLYDLGVDDEQENRVGDRGQMVELLRAVTGAGGTHRHGRLGIAGDPPRSGSRLHELRRRTAPATLMPAAATGPPAPSRCWAGRCSARADGVRRCRAGRLATGAGTCRRRRPGRRRTSRSRSRSRRRR